MLRDLPILGCFFSKYPGRLRQIGERDVYDIQAAHFHASCESVCSNEVITAAYENCQGMHERSGWSPGVRQKDHGVSEDHVQSFHDFCTYVFKCE